jgi:hypothetical protein
LILFGVGACFLAVMFVQAHSQRLRDTTLLCRIEAQVEKLQLTDLCLFTEARYTRNPSQTDLCSAFQDHPVSLEHFPAGSIVPPPPAAGMGVTNDKLD